MNSLIDFFSELHFLSQQVPNSFIVSTCAPDDEGNRVKHMWQIHICGRENRDFGSVATFSPTVAGPSHTPKHVHFLQRRMSCIHDHGAPFTPVVSASISKTVYTTLLPLQMSTSNFWRDVNPMADIGLID